MDLDNVAILIGIAGSIIAFVWSANKMAFFAGQFLTKVDHIKIGFERFERSFEEHTKEEKAQSAAMWNKMDLHGDKLIEHEQRIGVVEKRYE
jgi:hypothetical protein